MSRMKATKTGKKRTGIVAAIFAAFTAISSIRTLKSYIAGRKKKK
jgi:hypothetical protein